MEICTNCTGIETIQDQGVVLLKSLDGEPPQLPASLGSWMSDSRKPQHYSLQYSSIEQLIELLKLLEASASVTSHEGIEVNISGTTHSNRPAVDPKFHSLSLYLSRIRHHNLISIIQDAEFASYMQPIFDAQSTGLYGYEFLLRSLPTGRDFSPFELFKVAQETGLHSFLDRQARISAVHTSSTYLPQGLKRFINFLPSSIYNPNFCLSHTFKAIDRTQQDPKDFVFEVVETERIVDIHHLQNILKKFKEYGMKVALDDVGIGFSTVDTISRLAPDIVKIDRNLISLCDSNENKLHKIKEIVDVSKLHGALILAEGIERAEEWVACKSLGVQLVQGYLFGKPLAVPISLV